MQRSRSGKTLSCAECRRLKIKCDLEFPCKRCRTRGLASICPQGELSDGIRGQRVLAGTEELHRRISALEGALKQASSDSHPLLLSPSHHERVKSDGLDDPARQKTSDRYNNDSGSALASSDASDRLSAYSHLVIEDDPGKSRYYGAASSVYLAKRSNMHRQPDSQNTPLPPPLFDLPTPNGHPSLLGTPHPQLSVTEILVQYLPNEEYARELSDFYYKTFGWFTNIVPLDTFHVKYLDPIYHTTSLPRPQNLAVLFLILALGAVMDTTRTSSNSQAVHAFMTAARLSLALDMAHSVTLVQICYLYVTFVMNGSKDTSAGEAGWPYLRAGMAIAEAVGMHRDPGRWDLPEEDATERRVVFWEIHGYDVLQSIALGRGQCIADISIDCGLPDDGDETLFHRMAYTLTRIWSRINERQIRISPSPYSDVIDIDEALNDYERSLPHNLSPGVAPSLLDLTEPSRRRLAFRRNMLLMYLTEARMAVHRGWYVRALREYPADPLNSPQSRSFINCLEACRALVGLVRNMLALHDQQINKRWHFFFHLFSACACLAACAIRAPTSQLAPAVMAELDSGISLFKMAGRDETVQLERLAELGREAIRVGGRRPSDDSEDLDLLSARQTLHRTQPGVTATRSSLSHTPPSPNRPYAQQSAPFQSPTGPRRPNPSFWTTHPHPHDPQQSTSCHAGGHPLPDSDSGRNMDFPELAHHRQAISPSVDGSAGAFVHGVGSGPDQTFGLDVDWGSLGDFDMNAFLEEMGLLS